MKINKVLFVVTSHDELGQYREKDRVMDRRICRTILQVCHDMGRRLLLHRQRAVRPL